jgi:hypothetical protein
LEIQDGFQLHLRETMALVADQSNPLRHEIISVGPIFIENIPALKTQDFSRGPSFSSRGFFIVILQPPIRDKIVSFFVGYAFSKQVVLLIRGENRFQHRLIPYRSEQNLQFSLLLRLSLYALTFCRSLHQAEPEGKSFLSMTPPARPTEGRGLTITFCNSWSFPSLI